MSAQTGVLFFNDRDVATDFSLSVSALDGWPGNLGGPTRAVPVNEGLEMSGGLVDPRNVRRKPVSATLKAYLVTSSVSAAMAAMDALREVLCGGDVLVRTGYASDRHCVALLESLSGGPASGDSINGNGTLSFSFTVRDGCAVRVAPDGYALSTALTSCPIGTAESRPVITIHGGGASLTNPVINLFNAAGDLVGTMGFTTVLGATVALRVDCARMTVDVITAGVVTDGISLWTSGDFLVLRAWDALVALGAYPSVSLSASAGTAQGLISYTRRFL